MVQMFGRSGRSQTFPSTVILKLMEWLVARRLLKCTWLWPICSRGLSLSSPSLCWDRRVVKVLADILLAIDRGDLAGLALLALGPAYLPDAEIPGRQRLRSSSTSALDVPPTWLSTVGDRAFPVAAARTWNSLPAEAWSDVIKFPANLQNYTKISFVFGVLTVVYFDCKFWSVCKVTEIKCFGIFHSKFNLM